MKGRPKGWPRAHGAEKQAKEARCRGVQEPGVLGPEGRPRGQEAAEEPSGIEAGIGA